MRAAATNYVSVVIGCLLENGADGTLRSLEGKTAFDYAKENPYLKNGRVLDAQRCPLR
jgi:hypothetical protein